MFSAKTNTFIGQGLHSITGTALMLGSLAGVAVRHSSQTERQFNKLQKLLRQLTRGSDANLRNDVFAYGEAHFWGHEAHVDLPFGFDRIVDSKVAQAKKAA